MTRERVYEPVDEGEAARTQHNVRQAFPARAISGELGQEIALWLFEQGYRARISLRIDGSEARIEVYDVMREVV